MKKGETLVERILFTISIVSKMLLPPFYSFERLKKYCLKSLEKNPRAYSPRWFLAGLYKDYEKNEEAKREYDEIRRLGYMMEKDWISLCEVLFHLKDYQGVIESLSPIIDKYSHNHELNRCLGVSYLKRGDPQKGVTFLEKGIKGKRGKYEDYWYLGLGYDQINDLINAKAAYEKALSIKPDSQNLRENLALIHIKDGQRLLGSDLENSDLDGAELEFKKALSINPNDPVANKLVADIQKLKEDKKTLSGLRS